MSARALTALILAPFAVGVLCSSLNYTTFREEARARRRTASVRGQFDPKFRNRGASNGVHRGYSVTYHFVVIGVGYAGRDTVTCKPGAITIFDEERIVSPLIYYDPADPSSNQAECHKTYSTLNLIGQSVMLGSIALVAFGIAALAAFAAARRALAWARTVRHRSACNRSRAAAP